MKKTILATMTVAAALVASSPLAKANAFLEVISGGTSATTSITGSDSGVLTAAIGGWTVTSQTGSSSLFGLNLSSSEQGGGPLKSLEIIYSSGSYNVPGTWNLTGSASALGTLAADFSFSGSAYEYAGPLYTGVGAPSGLVAGSTWSIPGSFGLIAGGPGLGGVGGLVGNFTEIINITSTVPAGQHGGSALVTVGTEFTATSVPDGGLTIAMLGSVLIGYAGIRSKFGKRA